MINVVYNPSGLSVVKVLTNTAEIDILFSSSRLTVNFVLGITGT